MSQTVIYYTDCKYFGGAEEYLLTIFKKIDRKVWRPVLLYHPSEGNLDFVNEVKDLEIDTVAVPEVRSIIDFKRIYQLIKKLKSLNPAVFHANLNWPLSCSFGIVSAAISGIRAIVATQHLFEGSIAKRSYILQMIISWFIDRYIAVSKGIAANMKRIISSGLKVDVIHNGIIIEDMNLQANKEPDAYEFNQLRAKNNMPIVLSVARLHKQKGHTYLVESSTSVPDAIFVFAGDGPERDYLEKYSKELNVDERIIFLGHRDDIPSLINTCDLFVLPSLFEGFPLTILEAMAAGKPIVATDIPGTNEEVIHNETGLLVPPKDSQALAVAINSLLSNPAFARQLGHAGKIRAQQQFSSEKMVNSITDLYKELLNLER